MLGKIFKLGKLELNRQYREIERTQQHTLIDLFWECTLTCNAHCKHCGSSAEKKKYAGELTTQEAKDAFKQIAEDYDASKILINVTGGEPLTREDLCEVMEYATNGNLFHYIRKYKGLKENNVIKLCDFC